MAEAAQGSQGTDNQGTGGAGAQNTATESLGWRAALADEYKEHDLVKAHSAPTPFVKWAIDTKLEADALKTKLGGAIFKPTEGAKPEEIAAYRKAIGVPEKPTEYVFPEAEGMKNDSNMVTWAQGVFHKAGLSSDQAKLVGKEWNEFMAGVSKVTEEMDEKERKAAEDLLKKELGSEEKYKEGTALVARLLGEAAKPEEVEWLQSSKGGNHPLLVRLVLRLAQKTGEDVSPKGSGGGAGTQKVGFVYDKSPAPPAS